MFATEEIKKLNVNILESFNNFILFCFESKTRYPILGKKDIQKKKNLWQKNFNTKPFFLILLHYFEENKGLSTTCIKTAQNYSQAFQSGSNYYNNECNVCNVYSKQ